MMSLAACSTTTSIAPSTSVPPPVPPVPLVHAYTLADVVDHEAELLGTTVTIDIFEPLVRSNILITMPDGELVDPTPPGGYWIDDPEGARPFFIHDGLPRTSKDRCV